MYGSPRRSDFEALKTGLKHFEVSTLAIAMFNGSSKDHISFGCNSFSTTNKLRQDLIFGIYSPIF